MFTAIQVTYSDRTTEDFTIDKILHKDVNGKLVFTNNLVRQNGLTYLNKKQIIATTLLNPVDQPTIIKHIMKHNYPDVKQFPVDEAT